jgi:hypothetical protein
MAKSIYSFQGSKVHLKMEDRLAEGYNRAMKAWFQAQIDFEKHNGRKITVEEIMEGKLKIVCDGQDSNAYNTVVKFMNKLYDNGLVLNMDDCTSDYLEKL